MEWKEFNSMFNGVNKGFVSAAGLRFFAIRRIHSYHISIHKNIRMRGGIL